MGRFEVHEYLLKRRSLGDHEYVRYVEIHQGMLSTGVSVSYTSVWRSTLSLWSDGLLEVKYEGSMVNRTALFRAKVSSRFQSSDMKRVHNTYRNQETKSGRATLKRQEVEAARG